MLFKIRAKNKTLDGEYDAERRQLEVRRAANVQTMPYVLLHNNVIYLIYVDNMSNPTASVKRLSVRRRMWYFVAVIFWNKLTYCKRGIFPKIQMILRYLL